MTTAVATHDHSAATSPLTALDRCDRCGAQAYVQVTVPNESGSVTGLLFCGHHFRENEPRLKELAVRIHDQSDWLLGTVNSLTSA